MKTAGLWARLLKCYASINLGSNYASCITIPGTVNPGVLFYVANLWIHI